MDSTNLNIARHENQEKRIGFKALLSKIAELGKI